MQITINGEQRQIPDGATAAALLELLDLQGQRLAMEVNEEIVTRGRYDVHHLQSGDRVEIVRAVGGG